MSEPRWRCPECKSTHVQIGLPAWHSETKDFKLTYIETDFEAQIMWWYCLNCDESGHGQPDENP